MLDLIAQEKFELEVLDLFNSYKVTNDLVFGGGTMLRLCWGLNRFSVDLDFWLLNDVETGNLFKRISGLFQDRYRIVDAADKFYTLLFEIKSEIYPRSLKVEIRKEKKKIRVEKSIAYSKFTDRQVILNTVSLNDMLVSKIDALLDRKEIRDVFDIEFLIKKGIKADIIAEKSQAIVRILDSFAAKDYSVTLGSLLDPVERKYYTKENFKILRASL